MNKNTFIPLLTLTSVLTPVTEAQSEINCPILDCDFFNDKMVPGICFQHDGKVPTKTIRGKQCYNSETAKSWEIPSFCPFSYLDGRYAWINETLQSQEEKNLPQECKDFNF